MITVGTWCYFRDQLVRVISIADDDSVLIRGYDPHEDWAAWLDQLITEDDAVLQAQRLGLLYKCWLDLKVLLISQ